MISNNNYLSATRDSYGFIRITPQVSPSEPLLIVSDNIIEDQRLKAVLPSKMGSDSWLDKIIRLCQQIIQFLKQLFGCLELPSEVDQLLMATLLGDRSLATSPGLQAAPLNEVLHFTNRFLKHEAIPDDLRDQLNQCAVWAEQLARLKKDLSHTRVEETLTTLSQEISTKIKGLTAGQACLLPGGWTGFGLEGTHNMLYEVKRHDDNLFTWRLISCDPTLQMTSEIAWSGKSKIYPNTVFHSLTESEVSQPQWLEVLLGLQVPSTTGTRFTRSSLAQLFKPFLDRIQKPTQPLQDFRSISKQASVMKTVAVVVDEKTHPLALRKEDPARRRKLVMKLSALFEFYRSVNQSLSNNVTNRLLLKQGVEAISRTACLMHKRGHLSSDEAAAIHAELTCIETAVKHAEPTTSPSDNLSKPAPYLFENRPLDLQSITPKENVSWHTPEETRAKAPAIAPNIANQMCRCDTLPAITPPTPETLIGQLKTWVEECKTLEQNQDYLPLQERVMAIFATLPFVMQRVPNQNPIFIELWQQLSPEDRKTCSRHMQQLSSLLFSHFKDTSELLPDRLLAFVKATIIMDHLARLNLDETHYEYKYRIEGIESLIDIIVRGGNHTRRHGGLRIFGLDYELRLNLSTYSSFYYYKRHEPQQGPYDIYECGYQGYRNQFINKPIPSQVEDLDKQVALLKQLVPHNEFTLNYFEIKPEPKRILTQQFGRHFDQGMMRSAAFYGILNENTMASGLYQYSQEAINHDPKQALKAFKQFDEYCPKGENEQLPNISSDDFRDLFYLLARRMQLWELMGLLKERPYLFESNDVQAFIDHAIFTGDDSIFFTHRDVNHFKEFATWIAEHIEKLRNQGKISTALFLVDINQRMREHLFNNSPVFKDFRPVLSEWAHASLSPTHSLYKHRQNIWMHHLLGYDHARELSTENLRELMLGQMILGQDSKLILDQDPLKRDLFQRIMARWRPSIRPWMESSPEYRQETLDLICEVAGCKLPKETWSGSYPIYQAGVYEINLETGTLNNLVSGTSIGGLPPGMLKTMQETFPHENPDKLPISRYVQDTQSYFQFSDVTGAQNCVTQEGQNLRVYKEIRHQGQKIWAQHVSQEEFLPIEKLVMPDPSKGTWAFLCDLKHLICRQSDSLIPKFLLNPDYHYWINPKQPLQAYICNSKGELLFKAEFKIKSTCKVLHEIVDCRPGAPSQEPRQVQLLDINAHPLWKSLTTVDDPHNILAWSKGDEIESVELVRFGMQFKKKGDHIICISAPFKNWILDDNSVDIVAKKGIFHGLVFTHPTQKNKRRLLVPHQPLVIKEEGVVISWDLIYKFLKMAITKRLPDMCSADPIQDMFTLYRGAGKQKYWTYDIDPHTTELYDIQSPHSAESYLYLAQLALHHHQYQSALSYVLQAKKANPNTLSKVELKQYNALLNIGQNDPNSLAVKLQARFAFFKAQGSIPIYKQYIAFTTQIDSQLKLSQEQEIALIQEAKTADPSFYQSHAPLLHIPEAPATRTAQGHLTERSFHVAQSSALSESLAQHCGQLFKALKQYEKAETSDKALSRNTKLLSENFLGLYQTAQSADVRSPDFLQLKLHLAVMSPSQNFCDVLKTYLETVIDYREQMKDLSLLPAVPQIDLKQEGRTNPTLLEFLIQLDQFIAHVKSPSPSTPPQQAQIIAPFVDEVALKRMEEDLDVALKKIEAERPQASLDQLKLDDLEKYLKEAPAMPSLPLILEKKGDALYTPEQLKEYFSEGKRDVPTAPNLTTLKTHASSAVRQAGTSLEKEINTAKDQIAQESTYLIKNEAARSQLESALKDRQRDLEKQSAAYKEEVMALLQSKSTALHALHHQAKLVKVVEWDLFLKHFLQQDLASLAPHLPAYTDIGKLESLMRDYIRTAIQQTQLSKALDELMLMKASINAAGSDLAYSILSAERQFDADRYPHLLLFEYLTGVVMREDQLETVKDLVEDPQCIRQAITGAGKTTVILILTALLKANGNNMVSVLFPKHLFETNLAYLQSRLGKFYQRAVYPLRYQVQSRHVVEKKTDQGSVQESIFKGMYQNLVLTTLKKGVVVTTLETEQALEQKWIRLMDQMSEIGDPTRIPPIMKEHFHYLTLILNHMRTRESKLIDEIDKATTPREGRHLKVGQGDPIPEFIWKDSIEFYEELLKVDAEFGLTKKTHPDLKAEKKGELLDQVALALATKWAIRKNIPERDQAAYALECREYLRGRSEAFLQRIDQTWTEEEKDRIALAKEQFHIFMPLTTSKGVNVRYIRSKDGVNTVPCLSSDVPREGSEPHEMLEMLNQMIQDYIQTGIRSTVLKEWIIEQKREAELELEHQPLLSINETTSGKLFRSLFPTHSLADVTEQEVETLTADVNANWEKVKFFLHAAIQDKEISRYKITTDGQNLVSQSKETSGASATLGSLESYHSHIHAQKAVKEGSQGRMVLNFMHKTSKTKVVEFDPATPGAIVPNAKKEDPAIKAVVDGAGAIYGVSAVDIAKGLYADQGTIKGVYLFDTEGRQRVLSKDGVQSIEHIDFHPEDMGMALKEAEARGADFRIGATARFLVTTHARQPLPDMLQAAGRSRRPEQEICPAVPKESGLHTAEDIVASGVVNNAYKEAEDLFRAKKYELRDVLRNAMIEDLIQPALRDDLTTVVTKFRQFQSDKDTQMLMDVKPNDFIQPGDYFKKHCRVEWQNKKPLDVLDHMKSVYTKLSTTFGLAEATKKLTTITYNESVVNLMPDFVFGADSAQLDQEVEVDKDVDIEKDQEVDEDKEVEIDMTDEVTDDMPFFPMWGNSEGTAHLLQRVHGAYDKALTCSDNFIPFNREYNGFFPPSLKRKGHDRTQPPVHHIYVKKEVAGQWHVNLMDVLDTRDKLFENCDDKARDNYDFYGVYDLRAKRMIHYVGKAMDRAEEKQWKTYLAQIRFFNGEYRNYSEEEFALLKEWLRQHDPKKMETYFVNTVLRHRPKDRQKYPYSPLRKFFSEMP